jgi:hypothetical protein
LPKGSKLLSTTFDDATMTAELLVAVSPQAIITSRSTSRRDEKRHQKASQGSSTVSSAGHTSSRRKKHEGVRTFEGEEHLLNPFESKVPTAYLGPSMEGEERKYKVVGAIVAERPGDTR